MMNSRKFIAGAICPNCKKVDKLCVQRDAIGQRIECVSCHYSAQMSQPSEQKTSGQHKDSDD